MTEKYRTHYQLLGIDSRADRDEIKSAFRRLSMMYHPDRNNNSEKSARVFRLILNAYEIISEPNKRSEYDEYLKKSSFIKTFGKESFKTLKGMGGSSDKEILNQINVIMWEIDDLISGKSGHGGSDEYRKLILVILTFLDKWILEDFGFPDYFMEARKLKRLDPRDYISLLSRAVDAESHLPYTTVADYFHDVRKRTDRFITEYESKAEWDEPAEDCPGLIDRITVFHNMAVHYLSYLLNAEEGQALIVPPFCFADKRFR